MALEIVYTSQLWYGLYTFLYYSCIYSLSEALSAETGVLLKQHILLMMLWSNSSKSYLHLSFFIPFRRNPKRPELKYNRKFKINFDFSVFICSPGHIWWGSGAKTFSFSCSYSNVVKRTALQEHFLKWSSHMNKKSKEKKKLFCQSSLWARSLLENQNHYFCFRLWGCFCKFWRCVC